MLEMIDQTLDEVILHDSHEDGGVSIYVKKLLEAMEFDIPYTSNEIMEKLGLKSKEALRKNYLDPALELGLIRMTVPEKPRSRNQRYVKGAQ